MLTKGLVNNERTFPANLAFKVKQGNTTSRNPQYQLNKTLETRKAIEMTKERIWFKDEAVDKMKYRDVIHGS